MTSFHNFTRKMETIWASKVLKSILETSNTNNVIVYIWFITSRIK